MRKTNTRDKVGRRWARTETRPREADRSVLRSANICMKRCDKRWRGVLVVFWGGSGLSDGWKR